MDEQTDELHDCGYVEDSFACRIRHVSVLSQNSEARRHDEYRRQVRQEKTFGV